MVDEAPPLLVWTAEQVASVLQVSTNAVLNLYRCRQLTAIKVGRSLRFRPADIERFVSEAESANSEV